MISKNSPLKSDFQTIQDNRLKQIQEQLNRTCCQYDSLMSLLKIVDFIPQIIHHQKQLKNIQKRAKICQEKLKQKSILNQFNTQKTQLLFGHIQTLQTNLQQIKKQLAQFDLISKQQKLNNKNNLVISEYNHSKNSYQDSLEDFEKNLKMTLAQYKTQMDIHLNQLKKIQPQQFQLCDSSKNLVLKSAENFNLALQELDNQIQLTKGQLVTQDILKFHQFNYHRIKYEIVTMNQNLEQLKNNFTQQNDKKIRKKDHEEIQDIKQNIDKIKWQIIGSKKYYLRELSIKYHMEKNNFQTHQIQNKISKQFQQIQNIFKELVFDLNNFLSNF